MPTVQPICGGQSQSYKYEMRFFNYYLFCSLDKFIVDPEIMIDQRIKTTLLKCLRPYAQKS